MWKVIYNFAYPEFGYDVLIHAFYSLRRKTGPGGALRAYLEGLVSAKNVQKYVNRYPFGLPSITKSHRSWDFYERVIKAMERRSKS